MPTKILVTGGAGYIGAILVPELLNAGHTVTVLDNFLYGQNSLAHVCFHPNFHVVRGDTRVDGVIRPLLKQADVIIPLAAFVGAPLCQFNPVGARSVNRDAPLAIFEQLSPAQRVLMPTTNSAYGTGDANHCCNEDSPLNPISQYAIEKVAVEQALMARENAISYRLATVFGMSPRMRIDLLVNDFTHRAVYDNTITLFEGHFRRNYIHVRDVAQAFCHGIEHFDTLRGEIYNVGLSDANVSKQALCEMIQRFVPALHIAKAPIAKDPDQRNYIVSNEKIERTGFQPAFSLERGIEELIKGFTMIKNTRYGNM